MANDEKKVISKEMAVKEVKKWLDYKKCSEKKREDHEDAIETLVEAITEGRLSLDKEFNWVQTLLWPLGENGTTKILKYRPRVKMSQVEVYTGKVKAGNSGALIRGYICALCETASAVVADLDTEDNRIAQAIATFFL